MQKIFSIREALRFGWSQTKKHYMILCGAAFAIMLITLVFKMIGADNNIAGFVHGLINLFIALGITRLSLAYAEDTKISFHEAFVTTKHFGNYLLGCIYAGVTVVISMIPLIIFIFAWGFSSFYITMMSVQSGTIMISSLIVLIIAFVLLLIPVIMVNIRLKFFPYLILDKGMTAYKALCESFKMTKGYTWKLVGFGVVLAFINIAGLMTVVGIILTLPITFIAIAYVYRRFEVAHAVDQMKGAEPVPEVIQ
jgi:uncharacterized membrane protein